MQVRATKSGKFGSCGCGKTNDPNGNCDGSHSLTESQYQARLLEEAKKDKKK